MAGTSPTDSVSNKGKRRAPTAAVHDTNVQNFTCWLLSPTTRRCHRSHRRVRHRSFQSFAADFEGDFDAEPELGGTIAVMGAAREVTYFPLSRIQDPATIPS
jgi:hypothetical protein